MNRRTASGILITLAVTTNAEANGIEYAAVYRCHANAVNTALVRACSVKHPHLAQSAEAAFATWTLKWGERASLSAKACPSEMERVAKSPEGRDKLLAFTAELLGKMTSRIETESADEAFCRNGLEGLASDHGLFGSLLEK